MRIMVSSDMGGTQVQRWIAVESGGSPKVSNAFVNLGLKCGAYMGDLATQIC